MATGAGVGPSSDSPDADDDRDNDRCTTDDVHDGHGYNDNCRDDTSSTAFGDRADGGLPNRQALYTKVFGETPIG
jgi:hypothetical protein